MTHLQIHAQGRPPRDLVRLGTLTGAGGPVSRGAAVSGLNALVAGGTQAAKATLLNCLSAAIPARERVVTCEEVFELANEIFGV